MADWHLYQNSDDINLTGDYFPYKMPAPVAGIFDYPAGCLRINSDWISFILGRLEPMTAPEIWKGTFEEKDHASQEMLKLLLAMSDLEKCLYELPAIINPLNSQCLQINIPNDPAHVQAFFDTLAKLADPDNWQGSSTDRQAVADVWSEVIATAEQNWESGECIMPAQFRNNNGVIEYQPYGGTGWTSLGDACPCESNTNTPQYNPEQADPDASACAIATGLVDWLDSKFDDQLNEVEAAADTVSMMDSVFGLFPPAYIIADGVIDAINEILEAGVNIARAWMDTDKKEEMQEYLYCSHLVDASPPQMTTTIWNEFKSWVDSNYATTPGKDVFTGFLNQFEYTAIDDRARMASYGEGNCAGMACAGFSHTFDFLTDAEGWDIDLGSWQADSNGHIKRGVVFNGSNYTYEINMGIDFEPRYITKVSVSYERANSSGARMFIGKQTAPGSFTTYVNDTNPGAPNPYVNSPNDMTGNIYLSLGVHLWFSASANPTIKILSVTIEGEGTDPFI